MRYRDECMPLVSSVDNVYYLLYDLRVAQLNNRNDCSPFFYVEKLFPVFWYTLPHAISQTKSVCEIERISVCALSRIYITCTSTNYVDVPDLAPSMPQGRSHS